MSYQKERTDDRVSLFLQGVSESPTSNDIGQALALQVDIADSLQVGPVWYQYTSSGNDHKEIIQCSFPLMSMIQARYSPDQIGITAARFFYFPEPNLNRSANNYGQIRSRFRVELETSDATQLNTDGIIEQQFLRVGTGIRHKFYINDNYELGHVYELFSQTEKHKKRGAYHLKASTNKQDMAILTDCLHSLQEDIRR